MFVAEDGEESKVFRFAHLPTSEALNVMFLRCFARVIGPGGSRKTLSSATSMFAIICRFARLVHASDPQVVAPHQLAPRHISAIRVAQTNQYSLISGLRVAFRGEQSLRQPFLEELFRDLVQLPPAVAVSAYSPAEFRQIMDRCRATVKAALSRVRGVREEMNATDVSTLRSRIISGLLDHGSIETALASENVPPHLHGGLHAVHSREAFPTRDEVAALFVLLIGATGHNPSTLSSITANYAQSTMDGSPSSDVAFVRASKPRRGRDNSEMTLALQHTSLDDEDGTLQFEPDNYRSPLGLFRVALELCADTRRLDESPKLLVSYSIKGRTPSSRFMPVSARQVEGRITITNRDGSLSKVRASSLRKHYLEKAQSPVANSATTLGSKYLAKNKESLPKYQGVVGDVLNSVVLSARGSMAVRTLSADEREAALRDPGLFGGKWGISGAEVERIFAGERDTVAASCSNESATPFRIDKDGRCVASFLMCLGCPCALSEPRHHPVQALLWLKLGDVQMGMLPDQWNTRFAAAFSQLTDLLDRQKVDVNEAAARASSLDSRLLDALLSGLMEI
jgi:hypothetical protein